jgi:hypothetical protein
MPELPKVPEEQKLGDLVRRAMSNATEPGGAKGRPRTKNPPPSEASLKKGGTSVKKRKATTIAGARALLNSPGQDGRLRAWPQAAQDTVRTVTSNMPNQILGTTERALWEFFPALADAVTHCISKLTDEEAYQLRISQAHTSRVTISIEDIAGVVAELSRIEKVCGKKMFFGECRIGDASVAWRELLLSSSCATAKREIIP